MGPMALGPSPLVGYNTNVRHKGKLYHLQTEDSGVNHPHIITHLFADGGRVVASRKTNYAEFLGTDDLQKTVKKLMQDQHKAMFIALRDGLYDEEEAPRVPQSVTDEQPTPLSPIDVEGLDRTASAMASGAPLRPPSAPPAPAAPGTGKYAVTRPAAEPEARPKTMPPPKPAESIFGNELLSEKSLDEVILSYLAEDLDEAD